jgi:hypothetical protein
VIAPAVGGRAHTSISIAMLGYCDSLARIERINNVLAHFPCRAQVKELLLGTEKFKRGEAQELL